MATQPQQATVQAAVPPRVGVAAEAPRERRARLVFRRLDPWSVLKFSLLFYFCLLLVGILAFAVVWFVLTKMGVFSSLTNFAGEFSYNLKFPAGTIFRFYIIGGLVGVFIWSVATVLLTLLFNLVNDITGGIEVVLAESERRRN
jgi:hypothetical protein